MGERLGAYSWRLVSTALSQQNASLNLLKQYQSEQSTHLKKLTELLDRE